MSLSDQIRAKSPNRCWPGRFVKVEASLGRLWTPEVLSDQIRAKSPRIAGTPGKLVKGRTPRGDFDARGHSVTRYGQSPARIAGAPSPGPVHHVVADRFKRIPAAHRRAGCAGIGEHRQPTHERRPGLLPRRRGHAAGPSPRRPHHRTTGGPADPAGVRPGRVVRAAP